MDLDDLSSLLPCCCVPTAARDRHAVSFAEAKLCRLISYDGASACYVTRHQMLEAGPDAQDRHEEASSRKAVVCTRIFLLPRRSTT